MGNLHLNKWQRLVTATGAIICGWHAFNAYAEDDRLGLSFGLGVILAVLSLSAPHAGDEWLPFSSRITRRHAKVAAYFGAGVGFILVMADLAGEFEPKARYPYAAEAVETIPEDPVSVATMPPLAPLVAPVGTGPSAPSYSPSIYDEIIAERPARPEPSVPFEYSKKLRDAVEQPSDPVTDALTNMREREKAIAEDPEN